MPLGHCKSQILKTLHRCLYFQSQHFPFHKVCSSFNCKTKHKLSFCVWCLDVWCLRITCSFSFNLLIFLWFCSYYFHRIYNNAISIFVIFIKLYSSPFNKMQIVLYSFIKRFFRKVVNVICIPSSLK